MTIVVQNERVLNINRCVAQFGRALRSGRRGRRFKSCRIDLGIIRASGDRSPLFFARVLKIF